MKRKILYALLSAAIAFGLWLYVITTVNPDYEDTIYDIPVVLANESALNEHGLMLDMEKTPTVTLKLSGNRSDITKLDNSNITLVADLSKIYDAGEQQVSYSISFPGEIPNNSIEILSKSTGDFITLKIVERKSKEVPVALAYSGAVPEGFRTDKESMTLNPQTVTVTGPASVVDQITQAGGAGDLTGKTQTITESCTYTLCNEAGEAVDSEKITTDVAEVELSLKIQRYKEITLKLNVTSGGGATAENTQIDINPKTIQVSGSEQLLEALGDELVIGDLKLGELAGNIESAEYEIKLPEGIENLTGKLKATVSVTLPDLVTRTFQVTNIRARSVPSGMSVKLVTEELTVTMRGPEDQIDELTEEDISVAVDFSQAKPGTDTYKALIYVDSTRFGDVGAVGPYTVTAELKEEEAKD